MQTQIKKISLVSVGNIANSLLGAVFITSLAKVLPLGDFGRYALLTSLLVAMSKIIDFGSNSNYVANSIASSKFKSENFLGLKIILYIITVPISLVTMYFLNVLTLTTGAIFSLGLLGYGLNLILFTFFQKLEKFHFAVAINTVPSLLKGFMGVALFAGLLSTNLLQAFSVFSLSIFLSSIFFVFLPKDYKNLNISFKNCLLYLRESYPAGVSILIVNGWSAISNSIAKIAKSFVDVGIFSIADKIANIFTLISFSIFTVLLPKNAKRKREKLEYDLRETLLISGAILALAVFGIFLAKFVFIKVFGTKFEDSLLLLDILIFSSAFTAIHSFIDNYFFVEQKTLTLMGITLSKLGVFFVLSLVLVPRWDLTGLAYANLFSSLFALITTISIVRSQIRSN